MTIPKLHIAVLMGGWSAERPVSLMSGNGVADALASGWLQQLVEGRNARIRGRSALGRITQSAEADHLIVGLQTTQLIQRRLHRGPADRKTFIRGLGDALHHAPALTVVGHQFGRGQRHVQCTKETCGDGAAGLRNQADGGATPGHAETTAGLQIDQCIGAQGKRGD
jgi:D-alanine-D-alanine ligase-like ATP-grasp enzyme